MFLPLSELSTMLSGPQTLSCVGGNYTQENSWALVK